ncbi:MAG: ABC transporter ATP-binding protein [Bacilli bacterium]
MNEFTPDIKANITDRKLIARIWQYVKVKKKPYIIAFFMMLIAVGLDLLLPVLSGSVARELGSENPSLVNLYTIVGVYAISLAFTYLIQYFQTMNLQKTGQSIIYNVREDVFRHIEKLSIRQLNSMPVGKLVTRVTTDVNALNELFTNIIINLIKNTLQIVGVFVVMSFISPKLSLYVGLITPVIFAVSYYFRKISRKVFREVRHNVSNINAFLSENLSGMKITQVFNQEEKKMLEFRERNNELRRSQIKQIFVFGIFRPSIYVLYLITIMMIFYFGSKDIINGGSTTYDVLIVFYQFVDRLFGPIQALAEEFNVLQSAFASSERLFDTLDTPIEVDDEEDAIELNDIKGEIEFKNVWFKYIDDEWVLKDVSFKINARETVAFVGATGSGKTTILSLIVRNYDIDKGQILIDGIDIKRIKMDSLRQNIGQMLQDVFLFSGTINSNIKMREDSITDEEVVEACKYVNADHFITQLPNKYEEVVRERGNNFSSGQRQLLSFARTVVHKPKIMILDEATANIDTETEVLIQDSLEKMMNIGTMIVVAHRLSTIQHADNIIVLQKGVVIESGSHQELLKQKGHYHKLYQLQYQDK